jgi:altronate hydrolase
MDVLLYGDSLKEKGLNLLQSPGNDIVAATALTASGAHIVLFTTGLGTPVGVPAPTLKISSNTRLYQKKKGWIDFNAGSLVSGGRLDEMAEELYKHVIRVAAGELTKSEQQGIREIAIFKNGVTL